MPKYYETRDVTIHLPPVPAREHQVKAPVEPYTAAPVPLPNASGITAQQVRDMRKVTVVIPADMSQTGAMYSYDVPKEVADYLALCERVRVANALVRNGWGQQVADFVRGYKLLER